MGSILDFASNVPLQSRCYFPHKRFPYLFASSHSSLKGEKWGKSVFVSRLYIVNYRSIRELDLHFAKGKNVIIGRNNCGKSNIVRALHIVLGETSPTYQKSENITLGDFHSWKEKQGEDLVSRSANELFIW